mmetsp:Transcript_16762/g.53370  ORF Transcript_16762/g.53370 Transcript_16762/m.53370 type:complete len:339 (+) Transcript_16762:42-1058(+)
MAREAWTASLDGGAAARRDWWWQQGAHGLPAVEELVPEALNSGKEDSARGPLGASRVAPAPITAPVVIPDAHFVPGSPSSPSSALYRRRPKRVKRVIDLTTFSPYFRTTLGFGAARGAAALYCWASFVSSAALWSSEVIRVRGSQACVHLVTQPTAMFFAHPICWTLVVAACKLSLGCYLCICHVRQMPRARHAHMILEHLGLPCLLANCVYFWGAYVSLDDAVSRGLAVNNLLVVPTLILAELWASKTPFLLARMWGVLIYIALQVCTLLVFAAATGGCYILPGLDPRRNIIWISYPGVFVLHLGAFLACYALAQFRDHVAPCGQVVLGPASLAELV